MLLNHLELKVKDLQKALETVDLKQRMEMTKKVLDEELQIFKLQGRIKNLLNKETPPALSSSDKFKPQLHNYKREEIQEYRQKMEKKKSSGVCEDRSRKTNFSFRENAYREFRSLYGEKLFGLAF